MWRSTEYVSSIPGSPGRDPIPGPPRYETNHSIPLSGAYRLILCLFIYSLFNDAFSISDYTASNEDDSEQWIGKDLEGSGRDLI
jgi:hypothetical protein